MQRYELVRRRASIYLYVQAYLMSPPMNGCAFHHRSIARAIVAHLVENLREACQGTIQRIFTTHKYANKKISDVFRRVRRAEVPPQDDLARRHFDVRRPLRVDGHIQHAPKNIHDHHIGPAVLLSRELFVSKSSSHVGFGPSHGWDLASPSVQKHAKHQTIEK